MSQVIYDIETYPNFFSLGVLHAHSDYYAYFECSEFRDDSAAMFELLGMLSRERIEMVGFNNLGFDYPVLHHLIRVCFDERGERQTRFGLAVAQAAYAKAEQIIGSGDRFGFQIWEADRIIPQVDLFKVHHFDNMSKSTSLKVLQFTMRAPSVEDLPIEPGTFLDAEQARTVGAYMRHDIDETKRFFGFSADALAFRREMLARLRGDVLNWSDVKIGSEILIQRLGKKACYEYDDAGGRQPRQTERRSIPLVDVIFPYVRFERAEFIALLERFKSRVVTNTKASVSDAVEIDGFTFAYGTGGIHGSVDRKVFRETATHEIVDADVTSLYPSIAIVNRLYPEHLGEAFCGVYEGMRDERVKTAKGSHLNGALKLGLNGAYGNSNNDFSPLKDPRYTMATTINGQLLLTMLAERLLAAVPGLTIIQINTDGITSYLPRSERGRYDAVCQGWEAATRLTLEYAQYASMFVRDVNSYIAVTTKGKVKRKGAYDFPTPEEPIGTAPSGPRAWHGDSSFMVVQKAADAALRHGTPVEIFVRDHRDAFDFMGRFKTPRSSKLLHGGEPTQRITRYYQSRPELGGLSLVKQSPPPEHPWVTPGAYKRKSKISDAEFYAVYNKIAPDAWDERIHTANKSTYGDREITVSACARLCNRAADFDWYSIDYEWYIAEAHKLVDVFT